MDLPFPDGLPPLSGYPPTSAMASTQASQAPTETGFYAHQSPHQHLQHPMSDVSANSQQLHQAQQQYRPPPSQAQNPNPFPPPQSLAGTWASPERDFGHYSYHGSPTSSSLPTSYHPSPTPPRSWTSPSQAPFPSSDEPLQASQQQLQALRLCGPAATSVDSYQQQPPMIRSSYPYTMFDDKPRQESPAMMSDHNSGGISPPPAPTMVGSQNSLSIARGSFSGLEDDHKSPRKASEAGTRPPSPEGSRKLSEPYAKLIYKAFMSRPQHSMSLQEIYQWFRDNTDKAKGKGKGWQNSIRHNLSMNGAFTKRPEKGGKPGSHLTVDGAGGSKSGRDNTEWYLEDWAIANGVQSTTRYRKGSGRKPPRVGPSHRDYSISHHHRSYHGTSRIRYRRPYSMPFSRGARMPSPISTGDIRGESSARTIKPLSSTGDATAPLRPMHDMTPPADGMNGLFCSRGQRGMHATDARSESMKAEYTPITPPDGLPANFSVSEAGHSFGGPGYHDYGQYTLSDVAGMYPGGQLFEDNFQEGM